MAEESCSAKVVVVMKFDMQCHESLMTAKHVKSLVRKYNVPLDLHLCAPTEGWTMDQLPKEVIGLYEQFFEFFGLRVPFSTLLLGTIRHFRVHISQLVPLGLNRLTMFELYCRTLGISSIVNLFHVFYKISKQGHWFSFEKRVGKNVGGKIFNEAFFEMKGWKDRFFFIDRRAIPDAMAWRHHDSHVFYAFPNNDFSIQDVRTLTERIINICPVPPGLLFGAGLATTWDFPGFFPVFKDNGGNVVNMSEYLRFLFLSGASIVQGNAIPPNHPVGQNTTHPLSADQSIPDKTDSQLEVEVEDPKKKKVLAAPNGAKASSGHVSSPTPLRTVSHVNQIVSINSGNTDGGPNAPDDENRSVSHSPRDLVSESVHNFVNVEEIKDKESLPHIESFVNLSGKPVHPEKEQAFLSETNACGSSHPLNRVDSNLSVGAPVRTLKRANPPGLGLAWLVDPWLKADILERFENLQDDYNRLASAHAECPDIVRNLVTARQDLEHNARLYTGAINHYKELKEKHVRYEQKVKLLEDERNNLSAVNRDQALKIQKLEAEVAMTDFALTAAERVSTDRARDHQKLVAQLSQAEVKKFDCIRKLLPTMVSRHLQNHEYKKSLLTWPSRPDEARGWPRGAPRKRSLPKNFDAYYDKKLYPMNDKLFEKEYPYIMKISSGYRHSVADHIKIHPNLAPSGETPAPTISKALGGSSLPPNQKKT
ncbi:hypothetical protein Tco_1473615 [Tanacetum coccineum]